ncbi:MAG TPA: sigma-70 family RNA polymerase sigma factor [Anaerolineales bacterium]|nr:sigma-70 family RNA polymerase sigma factor [Anaerolineales bacterium]HNN15051.1 sigma-70 family RNA polymerase sigma factor [Anaerolineales bacterium]
MVTNFHDLYQKYAQEVYRFAYWLCGDSQDAEDITSETFIRAMTSAEDIRTETVKGFLLTIARNLAFKRKHQSKRFTDLTSNLSAPYNGPEQTTETNIDLHGILGFLQTLAESDRAALLMHTQEDMSYEEISRVLGVSVTAARVKVHRTRIKLNEYRLKVEESIS